MAHQGDDDILGADYDPSYFQAGGAVSPIDRALSLLKDPATMSGVETLFKESYKFIRLADDLHEIRWYLNDIRLCFVALTASGYVGILLYALILCLKRRRRGPDPADQHHQNHRYNRAGSASNLRQRAGSRFENFDLEAGGATHDWADEQNVVMPPPPPPNGTAIRTSDGYRYKPPNQQQPSPAIYHQQQRLDAVDAKQDPVVISSPSSGSHQTPLDTGFIEKVK